MKFRLLLSCVAGLLGSLAISAQADTQLAHVTNNVVDSGSCTLQTVNGGSGWISNKITCGADVVYVSHNTNGPSTCNTTVTSGYSISGGCTTPTQNSYTLYKTVTPQVILVKITDVTNTNVASNPNCSVQSAGGMGYGSYTYVGYRVVCGSTTLPVTLTYDRSNGSCSVSTAPSGYSYSGSCNAYTIYQYQNQ